MRAVCTTGWVLVAAVLASGGPARGQVMTFDALERDDSGHINIGHAHSERGFTVAAFNGSTPINLWVPGQQSPFYAGSAAVNTNFFGGTIRLTSDDGAPFRLHAFQVSEVIDSGQSVRLDVVGTKADGSTVSLTVNQDATFGFETVTLPAGFCDLVEVRFVNSNTGNSFSQLEDLVLNDAGVDPVAAIESLVADVVSLNIRHGISNALDAKLQAALGALDDVNESNDAAAVNALSAFVQALEAQRGKEIPVTVADDLIDRALRIMEALSG